MEPTLPGLYASRPEPLPFAPSLEMRAFLCRRERGNVLVYTSRALASEAEAIEELGGVTRQYLNHRHEAEFVPDGLAWPVFVHDEERQSVAEKIRAGGTFPARHVLDEDFEVIPTPGHTPGSTSYLWNQGDRRVLFTGDTIYLSRGEWVAAVLDSSDRDRYMTSLELIRELDFDVLVPWIATAGQPHFATTDRPTTRRRIDSILRRVEAGDER